MQDISNNAKFIKFQSRQPVSAPRYEHEGVLYIQLFGDKKQPCSMGRYITGNEEKVDTQTKEAVTGGGSLF